jgi:hypothetical protein
MEFITQNIGTIAVLIVLAVIVGLVIFKMRKDKKEGKSGCGCGCGGCAMKDSCPSLNKK